MSQIIVYAGAVNIGNMSPVMYGTDFLNAPTNGSLSVRTQASLPKILPHWAERMDIEMIMHLVIMFILTLLQVLSTKETAAGIGG